MPAISFLVRMKQITSKENAIYKDALKLTRKKYRDSAGAFLIEGLKPLKDAADSGTLPERIFVDMAGYDELLQAEEWLGGLSEKTILLDRKLFRQISDTENSQGVISVFRRPEYSDGEKESIISSGNVVVLDRLQDPGNIGTIIRTAEAAGYNAVMAVKGSGDVYSPKAARAAAGSLLRMPVIMAGSAQEAEEILHKCGKQIAVTCLEGAENCFETDLTENIALVIGNEGQGVGRHFMDTADIRVKIPMEGRIESLNAAVAAGILMYLAVGGKI